MPARWRPILIACVVLVLWGSAALAANDSSVRFPPLYDSFQPPAVGQSYTDPVFGAAIKRVSDARNRPNNAGSGSLPFIGTEYSTASPFNSNNSRLILQHHSYFGLYDTNGNYLRDLPFAVNSASEPRWSRTDPNVLYYVTVNDLMRLDVAGGTSSIVRSFGEYAAIRGRGESDIGRDGDHFVFAADEPNGPVTPGIANRYVFVYELSTNTKGPVLDTIGHPYDDLYLAPDNSVVIGWLPTGTARFTGMELFSRNMVFQRQLTHALGHQHLTRDTNGDDLLVWTNSGDPLPIADCQNGIVKVRLSDAQQTCLLQLDWSLAVHITAGDGNGWVFVGTYDPTDPMPSAPAWRLYTNEMLQLKLDGTEIRRLFHHRSRQTANYQYQPRATVSRDGGRLVFTSNYHLQAILGYPVDYTDAYLVAVPAAAIPAPGPITCGATMEPGASFMTIVTGGSSALDWAAVYPAGQAAQSPWLGSYQYVALPRPQTRTFTAPAAAGTYQVRLFSNDAFTLLGSCSFSVTMGAAPLTCPATLSPGASFTTTVTGGSSALDWAAVYPAGQTANSPWLGSYQYVALPRPQSRPLTAPANPGTYQVRLFANDTFTLLGSCSFSVTMGAAPLTCPATVSPGASFTTTVTGGSSALDWAAVYPAGQTANVPWLGSYQYVPLPRPRTRTFTAPATPATYQLRLFANDGFTLLGSCSFPVAP